MIFKLLRNDRLVLTALAVAPVIAFFAARAGEVLGELFGGFVAIQFVMIVAMLTFRQAHVRATPFEMALPIAGRDLFSSAGVLVLDRHMATLSRGSSHGLHQRQRERGRNGTAGSLADLDVRAAAAALGHRFAGKAAAPGYVGPDRPGADGGIRHRELEASQSSRLTAAIFAAASAVVFGIAWPAFPDSFQLDAADAEEPRAHQRGSARKSAPVGWGLGPRFCGPFSGPRKSSSSRLWPTAASCHLGFLSPASDCRRF